MASAVEIDQELPPDTLSILSRCAKQQGDLARVSIRGRSDPCLLLSGPELIEQVLAKNHQSIGQGFSADRVALVLGQGLLVSGGELWKAQRQMIHPLFHRDSLERPVRAVERILPRWMDRWKSFAERAESVDLGDEMLRFSFELNLTSIFSADSRDLLETHWAQFFARLTDEPAADARENLKLYRAFGEFKSWLFDLIEQRRGRQANQPANDFLDDLLGARSKASNTPITDQQVCDEVMSLLIAGHVTIASALTHCCDLLDEWPEAAREVVAEVSAELGDAPPRYETVEKLIVTRQIVQECLRLRPPIWIMTRRVERPFSLGSVALGEGDQLIISPYIVHRRAASWPRPEAFDRTRFSPDLVRQRSRYAYLPFSAGPRICLGNALSIIELVMTVASLYRSYTIRFDSRSRDPKAGFVLRESIPRNATFAVRSGDS